MILPKAHIKYFILIVGHLLLLALPGFSVYAQVPTITSVTPFSGIVGTTITITGNNFGATVADNQVYFGATKGVVTAATPTSITVTLDTGATFSPVSVLNTTNNLYGFSSYPFLPTFTDYYFINNAWNFKSKVDIFVGGPLSSPYITAIGDLDGDGRPDLVINNKLLGSARVYRNVSTPGIINSASFSLATILTTGNQPNNVKLVDVDGDGLAEIVTADVGSGSLSVFQNTSTPGSISFAARVAFPLLPVSFGPYAMAVADFDGDGKSDIAVTSNYVDSITIFRNTATVGVINAGSFAAPIGFAVNDTCFSPCAADFDGDGKPDLAVVSNWTSTVSLLRNNSTPGTISFEPKVDFATNARPADVQAGDIDGDGKPEIIVSNLVSYTISVLRNTSTAGTGFTSTSFAPRVDFLTNNSPAGIALGDLNGDGKIDIAVADAGSRNLCLYRNISAPGIINAGSFAGPDSIGTGANPYSCSIGDLDGDGYPDLIATNNSFGTISLIRNYPIPPVDTISGIHTICYTASPTTYIDTTTGGIWGVTNTALATISNTGLLTPIAPGLDTVYYYKIAGGDTNKARLILRIDSTPHVYPITGASTICASGPGSTAALANVTPSGTWSSNAPGIASVNTAGLAIGVTPGTTTITYTFTNTCGTTFITKSMTVNGPPVIGPITGNTNVCGTGSTLLSDTTIGGTWSSTVPTTATINNSGSVTGVNPGTTTIKYTKTGSCGTGVATFGFTVNAGVSAGLLSANPSSVLCTGTTASLSTTSSSGTWISLNNSVATVNASGLVSAVSADTVSIVYQVTNACGTAASSILITGRPQPDAGSITGLSGVCIGSSTTLTDVATGGIWSTSNAAATVMPVTSGGVVTGLASGTDTIRYTVNNTCGTSIATKTVTVAPLPDAGIISGANSVCVGVNATLTDPAAGGTWSASNGTVSVVSGNITGNSPGTDTISYTVSNACNTAIATKIVSVNPQPAPGVISGLSAVCESGTITLTTTGTGGSWVASNTHAVVTGGSVTGNTSGTDTISYIVSNSCGSLSATKVVSVNPLPDAGTITGSGVVCIGVVSTLIDASPGGNWNASNGNASVTGGSVNGITPGTDTISYTVVNGCGTDIAIKVVTINPQPVAGTITGPSALCPGDIITLTSSGSGGIWSATNTHASVTSGVVNGNNSGTDTIRYTVNNSCGSVSATKIVTVNPAPDAGTITGSSSICIGVTTTLIDTAPGGSWSASNSNANVTGGGTIGVSPGTDSIRYTVVNSCGTAVAVIIVTVNPQPVAGTITGMSNVCESTAITLVTSGTGGSWSASNTHLSVAGGIVTGNSAGIDTVRYIVSNSCGSDTAIKIITINPSPNAGSISGLSSVCVGSSITLTNTSTSGAWSTTNNRATVTGGVVNGLTPGVDTITYSANNSCGTAVAIKIVTVNISPAANPITGLSAVCESTIITLTETATGGSWSASNTNASVTGGVVTGLLAGVDTIRYIITNSCGTDIATRTITINPAPVAGVISGSSTVCEGFTITLTDAAPGGAWTASNGNATVLNGSVTANIAGIDTISYTVTNSCGTAIATRMVTINPQPVANPITGSASVCQGSSITLTETATGGGWNASNTHASVTAGVVTGFTAGTDTISYSVTNSCGTATATITVTVNPLPNAGAITGPSALCAGGSITLTDPATGGIWVASNSVATVSGGIVTGISSGMDTISYSVTNSCGMAIVSKIVTITSGPSAGTITGPSGVCVGANISLTDPVSAGTWTASNGAATVSGGLVHGMAAGVDTISYSVAGSCGSGVATAVVTVNPLPAAGIISGMPAVCEGAAISLTSTVAGGAWIANNVLLATVGTTTGIITGLANGTDTIEYIVSNGCGSDTASFPIIINPLPHAGSIAGLSVVCIGSMITLSDAVPGGTWSSSNTHASVTGGLVTALSSGTDTISYSISNTCGTDIATTIITIQSLPGTGTITGPASLCMRASIYLSDTASGGVWSSNNTMIASVNATGTVTGVNAGTAIIMYGVTNGCGTYFARDTITINPLPSLSGSLTPPSICDSSLFSYIPVSAAVPGAVFHWSRATVSGISNIAASGINDPNEILHNTTSIPVTVVYNFISNSGICADTQNVSVTVNPYPTLSGNLSDTICSGSLFTYIPESATPGAVFTSTRLGIAGISGPVRTNVSGNISETLVNATSSSINVVYIFTVSANGCNKTQDFSLTVDPTPTGPAITTESPSWVCNNTMYQNFGTANPPVAGVEYNWSTSGGATVWAKGTDRRYCLVNFISPGMSWIYLSTILPGFNCPSIASYAVNVGAIANDNPEVIYFNQDFICLSNNEDTYQWGYDDAHSLDSTIIYEATNQHYYNSDPDLQNKYYWVITTHNGCMQKSYYNAPLEILDLHTTSALSAIIKPNPNNGSFVLLVSSESTENAQVTVTDILGQVIERVETTTNRDTFIKMHAQPGIYFVTISTKQQRTSTRILITK